IEREKIEEWTIRFTNRYRRPCTCGCKIREHPVDGREELCPRSAARTRRHCADAEHANREGEKRAASKRCHRKSDCAAWWSQFRALRHGISRIAEPCGLVPAA